MTDIKLTKWVISDYFGGGGISLLDFYGEEAMTLWPVSEGFIELNPNGGCGAVAMTKQDFIVALQEAIAWIEGVNND